MNALKTILLLSAIAFVLSGCEDDASICVEKHNTCVGPDRSPEFEDYTWEDTCATPTPDTTSEVAFCNCYSDYLDCIDD